LERRLHSADSRSYNFAVISVFSRISPPADLIPFISLLVKLFPELTEVLIEDFSVRYEYLNIAPDLVVAFAPAISGAKTLTMTPSVFNARTIIFILLLTGHEDLSLRLSLFPVIAGMAVLILVLRFINDKA
jgi:hypothetical protein